MTIQDQVTEFHRTFGAPVGDKPKLLTRERYELRKSLIEEELVEYMVAFEKGDLVEIADALGDLLYVVMGTAVEHGMDMDAVVTEIHSSNMSKLGACEACNGDGQVSWMNPFGNETVDICPDCKGTGNGKPIYREDGKVLKGPNFRLPNLTKVLSAKPCEAFIWIDGGNDIATCEKTEHSIVELHTRAGVGNWSNAEYLRAKAYEE